MDEDLQEEYDAAQKTGLYDIVLFGYDQWIQEGTFVLNRKPDTMQRGVYRGWMMKPEQYQVFYDHLLDNNICLSTSPKEYAQFHLFPNIYPFIAQDTANILLFPENEPIDIDVVKKQFQRFLIKDYVKSVKGTAFPPYFDESITQEKFDYWMEVFYQYRGKLFTGGICIKEYLDLKRYDAKTNEYRVFYINHQIASISKNSGQPNFAPQPPNQLIEKYRRLPGSFYTIDYAQLQDDTWKIIETGDGSVSGLSDSQNKETFFRALYWLGEKA